MIMYCLGVSDMANLSIFMPHTTTTRGPTLNTHIKQFNVADIYTFSDSHIHMLSHTQHILSLSHIHMYTLPPPTPPFSLSHIYMYTLPPPPLSLSLTHIHSLSHTHTYTFTLTHTIHTLPHMLSLSHINAHALSDTHSHIHTLPHHPHTDTHSQIFELADDVRCWGCDSTHEHHWVHDVTLDESQCQEQLLKHHHPGWFCCRIQLFALFTMLYDLGITTKYARLLQEDCRVRDHQCPYNSSKYWIQSGSMVPKEH